MQLLYTRRDSKHIHVFVMKELQLLSIYLLVYADDMVMYCFLNLLVNCKTCKIQYRIIQLNGVWMSMYKKLNLLFLEMVENIHSNEKWSYSGEM